jgi:hypothetical protein
MKAWGHHGYCWGLQVSAPAPPHLKNRLIIINILEKQVIVPGT